MMPDNIDPATPFMQGYLRKPDTASQLVAAVTAAIYAHPEQRFGQLICNVLGDADLFNVYDEHVISALRRYAWREE